MKRHSSAASLVLAVLAVLGLAGPVAAGEQVPFRGRLEGVFTVTLDFPLLAVNVEATGNATHLGRFTLAIPHVVNVLTRSVIGSYHFIAANGDELFADHSTQVTVVPPGLRFAVDTAIITGGTGRFADASGEFTVVRLVDQATMTTAGSFDGTISSPGAAKKQ
jgi:hypothetical protein